MTLKRTAKIGFAGMTHLGINSAVAVAEKGFEVRGYDPDEETIGKLSAGTPDIVEPDLTEALKANADRMVFSAAPAALEGCDIVYISADVPTDDRGQSDLAPIKALINTVSARLDETAILVVLCQVPPGFCRALITSRSPLKASQLYYQVETLVFGRAMERARFPERYIIGSPDPDAPLPTAFDELLSAFDCPILPMRYESAELAKIAINCCLVAQVSTANTLAEICEGIGADWNEIVPALKLDKRIGQHAYLNAGLGISGGNLERDLATVIELSETHDSDGDIVRAWLANSHHRKNWPYKILKEKVFPDKSDPLIAILGLAYKENTHSIKNSPAIALLEQLKGRRLRVHDPVVDSACVPWAEAAGSIEETVHGADVVILMTPWAQYKSLEASRFADLSDGAVAIDPYHLLKSGAQVFQAHYTIGTA